MLIVRIATVGLLGLAAVAALDQAPAMYAAGGSRDSWPRAETTGNGAPFGTKSNVVSHLPSPARRAYPVHLALTN